MSTPKLDPNAPLSKLNRLALQRCAAREDLAEHLKIQCFVSAGLLFAYTLLSLGAVYTSLPNSDRAYFSTLDLLMAFLVAWISMRLRPFYTVVAIGAFLSATSQTINFRESDWVEYAKSASLFLLVFSARMRLQKYAKQLSQKIHSSLTALKTTSSRAPFDQPTGQLTPFILRSFVVVLTLCFIAYTSSFLIATLLSNTPVHSSNAIWRSIAIDSEDQFWPPAWFLVLLIAAATLLIHWDWRRLTPEQAAIAVRSQNLGWQYSDLRRVLAARRKLINKSSKVSDLDS